MWRNKTSHRGTRYRRDFAYRNRSSANPPNAGPQARQYDGNDEERSVSRQKVSHSRSRSRGWSKRKNLRKSDPYSKDTEWQKSDKRVLEPSPERQTPRSSRDSNSPIPEHCWVGEYLDDENDRSDLIPLNYEKSTTQVLSSKHQIEVGGVMLDNRSRMKEDYIRLRDLPIKDFLSSPDSKYDDSKYETRKARVRSPQSSLVKEETLRRHTVPQSAQSSVDDIESRILHLESELLHMESELIRSQSKKLPEVDRYGELYQSLKYPGAEVLAEVENEDEQIIAQSFQTQKVCYDYGHGSKRQESVAQTTNALPDPPKDLEHYYSKLLQKDKEASMLRQDKSRESPSTSRYDVEDTYHSGANMTIQKTQYSKYKIRKKGANNIPALDLVYTKEAFYDKKESRKVATPTFPVEDVMEIEPYETNSPRTSSYRGSNAEYLRAAVPQAKVSAIPSTRVPKIKDRSVINYIPLHRESPVSRQPAVIATKNTTQYLLSPRASDDRNVDAKSQFILQEEHSQAIPVLIQDSRPRTTSEAPRLKIKPVFKHVDGFIPNQAVVQPRIPSASNRNDVVSPVQDNQYLQNSRYRGSYNDTRKVLLDETKAKDIRYEDDDMEICDHYDNSRIVVRNQSASTRSSVTPPTPGYSIKHHSETYTPIQPLQHQSNKNLEHPHEDDMKLVIDEEAESPPLADTSNSFPFFKSNDEEEEEFPDRHSEESDQDDVFGRLGRENFNKPEEFSKRHANRDKRRNINPLKFEIRNSHAKVFPGALFNKSKEVQSKSVKNAPQEDAFMQEKYIAQQSNVYDVPETRRFHKMKDPSPSRQSDRFEKQNSLRRQKQFTDRDLTSHGKRRYTETTFSDAEFYRDGNLPSDKREEPIFHDADGNKQRSFDDKGRRYNKSNLREKSGRLYWDETQAFLEKNRQTHNDFNEVVTGEALHHVDRRDRSRDRDVRERERFKAEVPPAKQMADRREVKNTHKVDLIDEAQCDSRKIVEKIHFDEPDIKQPPIPKQKPWLQEYKDWFKNVMREKLFNNMIAKALGLHDSMMFLESVTKGEKKSLSYIPRGEYAKQLLKFISLNKGEGENDEKKVDEELPKKSFTITNNWQTLPSVVEKEQSTGIKEQSPNATMVVRDRIVTLEDGQGISAIPKSPMRRLKRSPGDNGQHLQLKSLPAEGRSQSGEIESKLRHKKEDSAKRPNVPLKSKGSFEDERHFNAVQEPTSRIMSSSNLAGEKHTTSTEPAESTSKTQQKKSSEHNSQEERVREPKTRDQYPMKKREEERKKEQRSPGRNDFSTRKRRMEDNKKYDMRAPTAEKIPKVNNNSKRKETENRKVNSNIGLIKAIGEKKKSPDMPKNSTSERKKSSDNTKKEQRVMMEDVNFPKEKQSKNPSTSRKSIEKKKEDVKKDEVPRKTSSSSRHSPERISRERETCVDRSTRMIAPKLKPRIFSSQKDDFASFKQQVEKTGFRNLNVLFKFENYLEERIVRVAKDVVYAFSRKYKQRFTVDQAIYEIWMLFKHPNKEMLDEIRRRMKKVNLEKPNFNVDIEAFELFQKTTFQCCVDTLKIVKYSMQNTSYIRYVRQSMEYLFPQFYGEGISIIKLWLWMKNIMKMMESVENAKAEEGRKEFPDLKDKSFEENLSAYLKENVKQALYNYPDADSCSLVSEVHQQLRNQRKNVDVEIAVMEIIKAWTIDYFATIKESLELDMDNEDTDENEMSGLDDLVILDEVYSDESESELDSSKLEFEVDVSDEISSVSSVQIIDLF